MPRDFGFRVPKDQKFQDLYKFRYIPAENFQQAPERIVINLSREKKERKAKLEMESKFPKTRQYVIEPSQKPSSQVIQKIMNPGDYQSSKKSKKIKEAIFQPNPIMRLKRIVGFTGRTCPDIRWTKTLPQRLLFASGNIIVSTGVSEDSEQLFYKGHSDPVTCMEISKDGKILASCQDGEKPIMRIWNVETRRTLNKYTLNLKEVRCLSFNYNSDMLCVVGSDKLSRDEILIIELFSKEGTDKLGARIVARQISEFNILTIKFSPVENDRLVSCGRENIRFWRIKNQHLPGGAVVLNHHARNTIFTVFDYDFGKEENALVAARNDVVKRVLVGSKHGFLYQVNYDTRQLEAVFKIHDLSICSISISPGFCVTGSQDQYIRVWPLDFSEFFLEAQHEGVIISLDISLDGLNIGCGTSAGAISVLDLQSQSYKTLLRSHREDIVQLVYQEHSEYLISLSKDCTIRVWKGDFLEQAFEFNFAKQDECVCITPHPLFKQFVGGFESGLFRIFDIEKVEVITEHKFHNESLDFVKFSPKGTYLILGDKSGFYTLLNSENDYEFVKTFEPEINNTKIGADFTPDERYLATIGTMNSTINVYSLSNLTLLYSLAIKNAFAHTIQFTRSRNYELIVLTCDGKIKAYRMEQDRAKFRGDIKDCHDQFISSVVSTPNNKFLISAGGDKTVAVFDHQMRLRRGTDCLRYAGHACPIFSLASDTKCKTIYTAGGQEGIYVWEFLGDVDQFGNLQEDYTDQHLNQLVEGINNNAEAEIKHIHYKDCQEDRVIGIHIKGLENQDEDHDMKMEVARGELDIEDYDDIQRELRGIDQPSEDSEDERRDPFFIEGKLEQTASFVFKHMNNYKEEQIRAKLGYLKDHERVKLDIPYKHYYINHHRWDGLFDKVQNLNKNDKIIELEYCTGFNTSGHNNVIWNTRFNCMLYAYENKIIMEEFNNKRTQSVLNLPEYISSLELSHDGADVAVACATVSPEIFAPVYILNLATNTLKNRFLFHNRGIQMVKYSPDGAMLLSVGNLKDGKMALWSVEENSLICSTHDINPMHDIDWRPDMTKGPLRGQKEWEFCVGGRNKITKWRLSCETNSSLYIAKEKYFTLLGNERNISAVKYVYYAPGKCYHILAGMESGCLAIMNEKTLENLLEINYFSKEISSILYSRKQDMLVITSLDSKIKHWRYNSIEPEHLDPDTDIRTLTLDSGVTCITLDPDFEEGVASTIDGSLAYVSIYEGKHAEFIQGIDTGNGVQQLLLIGSDIIATVHYMGNAKLWSAVTGEILKELKWKFSITHVFYAEELRRIVFTLQNYDFLTMDVNNFNKIKLFKNQNPEKLTQGYMDNYIHKSIRIKYGEKCRYLFSTFKGETLVTDLMGDNIIHFKKVTFPNLFANISDFDFNISDNTLAIATNKGQILTYKCMDTSATLDNFNFKFQENFNCIENPHGDLDQTEEDKEANQKIYQFKSHIVKVRFARALKHSYVYTIESLQYVYVRDYTNKRLKKLITLESFPKCLEIDPLSSRFLVGREDGVLSIIDESKGTKVNYQSHFSDEILSVVVTEKTLKYIIGADNGFMIYKPVFDY